MLIYFKIKSTYTSDGRGVLRQIGWTLNKPKGFLVHLPSRVESLGDNLVKLIHTDK